MPGNDYSQCTVPFKPMNGPDSTAQLATVTAAFTGASSNVTLPVGDSQNCQIEVFNPGTGIASINFGNNSVAAAVAGTGYQVGPGQRRVITVDPFVTKAAAVVSIGGNLSFTRGMGT